MKHSARILFAVGLHILLCAVPASANMGFVMPPISIGVMVSVVLLTIVLSIVSGEATYKIKQIRDKGDGDIWFRVLGIPGIVTLGLYLLLQFLHVNTSLWPVSILFAALVILQLSRLHASTEQDKNPGSGWINWSIFSLPILAAVTLISPILFWFLGGMGNLILQVGLTVIWTCYGCYYGFNLYDKGTSARSGSYSFWAMRISGYILIPACIVIALGLSHAAYRAFRFPADQVFRWQAAKANVDQLRSALASYAADSDTNKYPIGEFNYDQIRILLPHSNLPPWEEEAKWEPGSFYYFSEDGGTFSLRVNDLTRQMGTIYGSPSEISPKSYPY